jgi:hypothetical protein
MPRPLTSAPPDPADAERNRCLAYLKALENDRASYLEHWREINDYVLPRRLRDLYTRDQGGKYGDNIINNTGTRAIRILGSGKMAGQTSPARPWFRYTVADPDLLGDYQVMAWLAAVERVVSEVFARSNLYAKLHELWTLQGAFGTAALYVEEDDEDDVRGYVFPTGQYVLASSSRGRVDTVIRSFNMTAVQLVREFGIDNTSDDTRRKYRDRQWTERVAVVHEIAPNVDRTTGKMDNWNMPFRSVWYERNAPPEWTRPLRRSGFEEFPVAVARWDVIGEDVYGTGCPGMDMLGDVKAIQLYEKRKAETTEKIIRPPLKAPVAARSAALSQLPGHVSYVDETAAGTKVEPLVQVRADAVSALEASIREHERRVMSTAYADLFQMMMMDDRTQPVTAREINERHEEKMLQLGPVVERDQDEVLDPIHNRVVKILWRRGKLPPMPKVLSGRRVKVEYISTMAQAQKLLGTSSTERFVSFIGSTSAVSKEILDIANFDKIGRRYAENLGMAPDEVRSEEEVAELRAQRRQAEQAAQQAESMAAGAQAAEAASRADLSGDNALSRLLNSVGGGGGPV